jgi:hypothetical protein
VFDLTIATTCWGGYGRYLAEWAVSVADQIPAPAEVVIAELGGCGEDAAAAQRILEHAGIECRIVHGTYTDMAAARNLAVSAARGEWVMHLDADDLLLPGALRRCVTAAESADVIPMAARYPSGRVRPARHVTARWVLSGRIGVLSCSPYRRSLWQAAPYRRLDGPIPYIDALLWVGFAKMGARFRGLTEPGFTYRQHDDSFRRTLTPVQLAAARRAIRQAAAGRVRAR